ncbi:hypothetical protein BASA61_003483 [Batrachochytrium salamandrivorans]|nr:hypothetical protein BASA62_005702 [Batrachochytrium salamandrivorans]KAH6581649.1 hypothetical protein BASA60_002311 [Batrachochytrium salamandrivorans]KAH6596359.1 hypothetical protein BASA61_003483 [Batrachochytrium salamandrivorans]KAH9246099.1 hypothetical protein BASA81_016376 [Batrachochytrium salamandrivorans]KAH9273017.1 hypothetical protein BASA83_004582 [Batrachochytrium salamandrivorans]
MCGSERQDLKLGMARSVNAAKVKSYAPVQVQRSAKSCSCSTNAVGCFHDDLHYASFAKEPSAKVAYKSANGKSKDH